MVEILENLPAELHWDVIKFLGPHPIVNEINQIHEEAKQKYICSRTEMIDSLTIEKDNYKKKHQKKPKHCKLIKEQLEFYQDEVRRCKRKNKTPPSTFYEYYF